MRIVENNVSRLVLRDRTLWVSFACFGCGLFLAGAIIAIHKDFRGLCVAAFLFLCGLVFLRTTDVVFDTSRRICSLRRRDLFRVTSREIGFDEISDVLIDLQHDSVHSGVFTYRLSLETADGPVPLGAVFEGGVQRFQAMRDALVKMIFAGRTAPPAADPVRTLVATGRMIDAVALLRARDRLGLTEARDRAEQLRREFAASPKTI